MKAEFWTAFEIGVNNGGVRFDCCGGRGAPGEADEV